MHLQALSSDAMYQKNPPAYTIVATGTFLSPLPGGRGDVKLSPLRRRSRGERAAPCADTVVPEGESERLFPGSAEPFTPALCLDNSGDSTYRVPVFSEATCGGGSRMTFDEILTQVLELLRREGRVSYRALKRRFA